MNNLDKFLVLQAWCVVVALSVFGYSALWRRGAQFLTEQNYSPWVRGSFDWITGILWAVEIFILLLVLDDVCRRK